MGLVWGSVRGRAKDGPVQGPSRPASWGREAPKGRGSSRAWAREGEGHTSSLCLCPLSRPPHQALGTRLPFLFNVLFNLGWGKQRGLLELSHHTSGPGLLTFYPPHVRKDQSRLSLLKA